MTLISEACYHYGWTPSQCLRMPAMQFFAMIDEVRRFDAINKLELCDMIAIAACDGKWYETVKQRYINFLNEEQYLESPDEVKKVTGQVYEAGSESSRIALFSLFAAKKRIEG